MAPRRPSTRAPTSLVPSLPSQDLAAIRDFYVRDLGLQATVEEPGRLVVRVGSGTLEFRQQDAPPVAPGGLRLTFGCTDPEGLLRRLRALGVEVDVPPPARSAAPVRFLARDPDGRLIAFVREDQ